MDKPGMTAPAFYPMRLKMLLVSSGNIFRRQKNANSAILLAYILVIIFKFCRKYLCFRPKKELFETQAC